MTKPKYYPPTFSSKEFHCALCGVYANQTWFNLFIESNQNPIYWDRDKRLQLSYCTHCKKLSYWLDEHMVFPTDAPVPQAHPEMPEVCLSDYNEAREIVVRSPRAAAALLRLVIQKLMSELKEKGKNIDEDIGSLVQKGMSPLVQKALDFCRVVCNNSVHPGELNLNDSPEIAYNLFDMINFIIDDRVARPKQIQMLYEKLPEGARNAVDVRDTPKP
jgi:hypothetical protein